MRVAGIGYRAAAPMASIAAVLEMAVAQSGPVGALATVAEKADGLRPLAKERGLTLTTVQVAGVPTPTQSDRVQARFGTGSLAEAAALAAAGPGARLVVGRLVSPDGMATAAVAESLEGGRE